jgi:cob(I)alamin adenosyltransferase
MIYNFCGDTKGKTSSALGTVMRALGAGKPARIVFFMKHWNTSENEFLKKLKKNDEFDIDFCQSGDKDFIYVKDINKTTLKQAQNQLEWGKVEKRDLTDIEKAQRGMKRAWKYLEDEPFLLVLDELNYAVTFGLIKLAEAKELLEKATEAKTHIIITGKDLHPELGKMCDLITEMKKIKHPYDDGVHAVKGLDY